MLLQETCGYMLLLQGTITKTHLNAHVARNKVMRKEIKSAKIIIIHSICKFYLEHIHLKRYFYATRDLLKVLHDIYIYIYIYVYIYKSKKTFFQY